jgi:hypothetical protein
MEPPETPGRFSALVVRIRDSHGIRKIRFHAIRHTSRREALMRLNRLLGGTE